MIVGLCIHALEVWAQSFALQFVAAEIVSWGVRNIVRSSHCVSILNVLHHRAVVVGLVLLVLGFACALCVSAAFLHLFAPCFNVLVGACLLQAWVLIKATPGVVRLRGFSFRHSGRNPLGIQVE